MNDDPNVYDLLAEELVVNMTISRELAKEVVEYLKDGDFLITEWELEDVYEDVN